MSQPVVLYAVTPETPIGLGLLARPAGRCTTGAEGTCVVDGLPPGAYTAEVRPILDPNLCAATGPPAEVFGTVTLANADAKARFRIGLPRGVRIALRVITPSGGVSSKITVTLTGENGEDLSARFDPMGRAWITVPAGRWVARLVGPPGALIVAVELDGIDLDTADVPIEISSPSSDRFVTWTLTEPCRVWGTITSTRPGPGVSVGGTLLVPGPWAASPFCRATNCAGTPQGAPSPEGRYGFDLACGSWRIAPFGDSLLESDPPFTQVDLKDGEVARADFFVRETDPEPGRRARLSVRVLGPDGKPVASAPVEVWPPDGKARRDTPIDSQSTGKRGEPARFVALAGGSYLLRVRAPGCRTAVEPVPELDPDARDPRRVTIRLRRGATIDALVRDEEDRPVMGVGLDVTRTAPPSETNDPVVDLEAQDEAISLPPSVDQTGHLVVSGLSAGSYRVRLVPTGALAVEATIVVGRPGEHGGEETTVRLEEDDQAALDVRVVPAASLGGRLVCADGTLLPRDAEACVLPGPSADEDDAARAACRNAVLPVRMTALMGDARNEFRVGPLTPGSFRLGLRPRGFAAWTWALGTPDDSDAALVQVLETSRVDLGTIEVLCGPAIEVRPSVDSGDPLPDLTTATVAATLSRPAKDGTIETRRLSAEQDADRVVFRELPEGEWTFDITITNPFFLPAEPIHLVASRKLERGALVFERPVVPAVGGAIVLDAAAAAARLVNASGETRIEFAGDGKITFAGVAPGVYRVEACEDVECSRVTGEWEHVRVVGGGWTAVGSEGASRQG